MAVNDVELHYDEFLKAVGKRIKMLRKDRGFSLHDMVVKHGYHDSQWRRFEREGAANLLSLLKIARAFDTSLSNILDGLGEFPAETVAKIEKNHAPTKTAKKTAKLKKST